jgi:eukaryotic-like serine/threonine-protein kinase
MTDRLKHGTMIAGRYRIVERLGSGGMGTVYLADDLKLPGKQWAVKELHPERSMADSGEREAAFLMALDHPYLPKIIDFFRSDGVHPGYLVMEYVRGINLQQQFERSGSRLSQAIVVQYMIQLSEALEYLHQRQTGPVVYRDLKPSNVMVDEHDRVRLIDFGIARRHKLGGSDDTVKLGSAGFASPEQFQQKQTDPRSDLYSLGAMMYYLLTGGQYFNAIKYRIHQVSEDVDPELAELVDKLLSYLPEDRHPSAAAVKEQLEQIHHKLARSTRGSRFNEEPRFIGGKLIVVGSLYSGAGSTLISIVLARAMSRLGIPHALGEWPGKGSDLYSMLDGERLAPSGYSFVLERPRLWDREVKEWREGHSVWLPCPLESRKQEWDADQLLEAFRSVGQPILMIDISNRWLDPMTTRLIQRADEWIVVAGPDLPRYQREASRSILKHLEEWAERGKSMSYIANRSIPWRGRNEWLEAFPTRPVCEVPNIPYEELVTSIWKGKLTHMLDSQEELLHTVHPLIKKLFPEVTSMRSKGALGRFAQFFSSRGLH